MVRTAFKRAEPQPAKGPRQRKCAICRQLFAPRSMTHKACKPECAVALGQQAYQKRERKADAERRAKLKTRSDWMREAQQAFNAFIRERDKNQPCISSGVPLALEAVGGGYDCGHYRSVGSAPHLRFDERNAHGQSKKENRYLSGNATAYRLGLIARIGLAAVEALEADDVPRKHSIDDLRAIRDDYRAKLRALKAAHA